MFSLFLTLHVYSVKNRKQFFPTVNVNPLKLINYMISFNSVSIKTSVVVPIKHSEYTVFHVKSLLTHGNSLFPLVSCCEGPLWTKDPMRVFRYCIAYTYSMWNKSKSKNVDYRLNICMHILSEFFIVDTLIYYSTTM